MNIIESISRITFAVICIIALTGILMLPVAVVAQYGEAVAKTARY